MTEREQEQANMHDESMKDANNEADPARQVKFTYKNHAGKVQTRYVVPMNIFYGISDWHPEAQWLLNAYDVVKMEERTFAMKDISEWAADEPV